MTSSLSSETFQTLREFIYQKSGLEFPDSKKYLLESRLQSRLLAVHCQNFEEYYKFLRFDPQREKEIVELFNCVTTNETFFFRDKAQLDCFQQVIVPQVTTARDKVRKLRIWSAGCSSGEEPYTLAMIIMEEFPALANWDVQIVATDLSEKILEAARLGVYGPYSVRNITPPLLQKYFTFSDGVYTVGPALRKFVTFSSLNLFDSLRMRSFRDIDVIFCRNVLIYFDQEARRKIITNFYDSLQASGVLMIGFSESLSGVNRLFHPIPWNKTVMYRKAGTPVAIPTTPSIDTSSRPTGIQVWKDGEAHSGQTPDKPSRLVPVGTGNSISGKVSSPEMKIDTKTLKSEPRGTR
ncbi:protein-glutamate O-methyltransferase CheR [Candidatus Nitronereus thalassa]|uniref:protein-glutamate O-methyltransferase n=1 Tax=Candidatus Nitronereus thalassa TaxID=3020898 RepID=A0ABU3K636_9BACT|nr:protein-glutamate O-methyltransferase CheR [Candidatus Nitronereus thalassa]MDT7041882.1 protein-glutamate O-methyltransferase CheR [Candidatus Nitronereus thalassa]